jgi:serine/threonine protein phosphatase PrpC
VTDRPGELAGTAGTEPRIDVGQLSVVGRVRTGNEDSVLCEPPESQLAATRGLFCAVADGMGGHAAGEEASQLAVQVAHRIYYETNGMDPLEALRLAVVQANTQVYEAGAGTTGRDHMGSTLTAAVLFNDRVVIGHVGDSRAYIVRGETIQPLTLDHSWVAEEVRAGRMTPEQARVSPRRNIITRALGLRPDVEVDAYQAKLQPGDLVVICSDGLHGLVSDEEIQAYVQRLRPADSVTSLVQLANERGGPDNISIVVARVRDHERDESDTARGLPVLTDPPTPTDRLTLAEMQEAAAQLSAPSAAFEPSRSEMPTTPGLPVQHPTPAEPAGQQPIAPLPTAQLPASPPPVSPGAPAQPGPQRMLARTEQPRQLAPRAAGNRSGGATLIVVLLFLLVLGAAIGLGLAYLANIPLLPGQP